MNHINELESLRVFRSVVDCGYLRQRRNDYMFPPDRYPMLSPALKPTSRQAYLSASTRHLHLTANGKLRCTHALYLIAHWQNMTRDVNDSHGDIEGEMRISAPWRGGL